jgi:REP element-mobilizing transposase RayT
MKKFQNKYRIPSARAQWWDYGNDGAYFITICTAHRECFFCVETPNLDVSTNMVLSELGEIVQKYWLEIPEHFSHIKLDAFVVMPNHFHGIIIIENPVVETETNTNTVKQGGKYDRWHKGVLGVVLNQYKRKCTIECRKINLNFGWQSRFYDNIIRNPASYKTISEYIINNPAKWEDDKFHPSKPVETPNLGVSEL